MNVANFYIDKGADFNGLVQINGVNNSPVCLDGWRFICQAQLTRNPKIKINVTVQKDPSHKGIIFLQIPYSQTSKMPTGTWEYDVEMTYESLALPANKRLRVVSGKFVVSDNVTTGW